MTVQNNILKSTLWNIARDGMNGAIAQVGSRSMTDGILTAMTAGAVITMAALGADIARSSCDLGLGRAVAEVGTETNTGIERGVQRVLSKSLKSTLATMFVSSLSLGLARRASQIRTNGTVAGVLQRGIPLTIFAVARTINALVIANEILTNARIANAVQDVSGSKPIVQTVVKSLIGGSLQTIASNALCGTIAGVMTGFLEN